MIRFLFKAFFSLIYDPRIFDSKYFTCRRVGYKWVIRHFFFCKVFRLGQQSQFPVHHSVHVSNFSNLVFSYDDLNNFQSPNLYLNNINAKIFIGKGSYIGPMVTIITTNHNLTELSESQKGEDVVIGTNCWLGSGVVILPGVKIGSGTIVGAGTVVTKSFEDGNVVICGNPARVVKAL